MVPIKSLLLALVATVSLSACTTDQYGNQQASRGLKGAGIGAAGGAAAGAIVGIVTEDRNRFEDRDGQRYYYERDGRQYRYDDRRRRQYMPR